MKRLLLYIPILLPMLACGPRKPAPPDTQPPKDSLASGDDSRIVDIQGHRGFRGRFPENSVEGFLAALDAGATTLEMDAVVSLDSQIVISHEPWMSPTLCTTPDGMTIRPKDTLRYAIFRWNYEDLRSFDCGSQPHPDFPLQQRMPVHKPTLAEVVEAVKKWETQHGHTARYNIEIKSAPEWDGKFTPPPAVFVRLLLAEIKRLGIAGRTTVQSFDMRSIQECFCQQSPCPVIILSETNREPGDLVTEAGHTPWAWSPQYSQVTRERVEACRKLGLKVIPWTVNQTSEMRRLLDLGVDGIITDFPDSLSALLKQR